MVSKKDKKILDKQIADFIFYSSIAYKQLWGKRFLTTTEDKEIEHN